MALTPYNFTLIRDSVDGEQIVIPGAQVNFYIRGTSIFAALFSDENGMISAPNPAITDESGTVTFYADEGRYDSEYNGVRRPFDLVSREGQIYNLPQEAPRDGTGDASPQLLAATDASATSDLIAKTIIPDGEYELDGPAMQIAAGQGYLVEGNSYKTILDASSSANEFDVISGAASVNEGVHIGHLRIRGSNVGNSYAVNWQRCRNAAHLHDFRIGEGGPGWGVNGVYQSESWYNSMSNALIRNLTGTGIRIEATDAVNTVNGVSYRSVFFNGNQRNVHATASAASRNTVANWSGCTFEKSKSTSNEHDYAYSVLYNACYLEGNGSEISDDTPSDIYANRSTVILNSCFLSMLSVADGASATSPGIKTANGGIVHIKDGCSIRISGRDLFSSDAQYTIGFYDPIDHTPIYANRYTGNHLAGQPIQLVKSLIHISEARQTAIPLCGTLTNYTGLRILNTVDFSTTASNEAFGLKVLVQDAFRGGEVRGGTQEWQISCRKEGASYFHSQTEIFNDSIANNAHSVVSFLESGSQVSIRLNTPNSGSSPALFSWMLHDAMAQLNSRFSYGAGF